MSCRYTYKGKTYELSAFDDLLRAMPPSEAAAFMPGIKSIPAAPFVGKTDAWLSLALKRVIKLAVDEGYDKVAFVNGTQSAERYDLSKQVSRVTYNAPGGKYADKYGTVLKAYGHQDDVVVNKTMTPEELPDYIGKEAAQRLLESKPDGMGQHSISGLELKVGGEGMKAFYDQIVPQEASKLVKKMGGDGLTTVKIIEREPGGHRLDPDMDEYGNIIDRGVSAEHEQPGFTVTPEMAEKASGALPLFSTYRSDPELEVWADDALSGRKMNKRWMKISDALPHPAWLMAGLDGRRQVIADMMLVSHLQKQNHQEVTPGMIGRLDALMANPRVVTRNEGIDTATGQMKVQYQALVDARDRLGRPLLVAVQHSTLKAYGDALEVVDIRNMFGRNESMQYVIDQAKRGNVVWMADKEVTALRDFMRRSTMLPAGSKPGSRPSSAITTVILPGDASARAYPNKGWAKLGNRVDIKDDAWKKAQGAVFSPDRAGWTPDRVESLLSNYAYTQNDAKTKAYAGWVSPEDFLNATVPKGRRDSFEAERKPLDRDRLAEERQEIRLDVSFKAGDRHIALRGHEGRHRMMALRDAGVQRVPVVYYVGRGEEATPQRSMYLIEQKWENGLEAEKGFLTGTLTPISYKYADDLRQKFGQAEAVQFSPDRQTETPEFKAWFEDSKVVDAEGKPLVVFHGTASDVQSFDPNRSGDNYTSTGGDKGFFFTNKPGTAGMYAEQAAEPWRTKDGAANIMPVYLSLKNPYVRLAQGSPDKWFDYNRTKLYKTAKERGFDGIVVKGGAGAFEARSVYVAFHPEQIKSAIGNDGGFDATNPDIARSTDRTLDGDIASSAPDSSRDSSATTAWYAPGASRFDDMVYTLQDKHVDTKRVVAAVLEASGAIQDDLDVYLQEELFHGRAAKRTQDFVNLELEPLIEQMKGLGLTVEELDDYLHARHAREANEVIKRRNPEIQDGGSGMLNQDAAAYFAETPALKLQALEVAAAKVDAMIGGTREMMVQYQLESAEKVHGWSEMFEHYVPLMREDEGVHSGNGTGQGFSIRGKEVKSRTGSTRKVVDILANVAMQRERTIVRGEKNRVSQALVGLAKANPNRGFWSVDIVPKTPTFNPATGLVEDRPDQMFKQRENVIVAKVANEAGEIVEHAVLFSETDPRAMRMAEALKNLDAAQLEGLLGASAKATRYFASVNTQYNPVFGVVNLVRDVQEAMINIGSTELAGKQKEIAHNTMSALRGIYGDLRAVRKGGLATSDWAHVWEDFQNVGGQTGYRQLFATSEDRAKAIEHALDPTAWMDSRLGKIFTAGGVLKVPMAAAQRAARWIFDWLSDYNEAMENGVRLAAYKSGLDAGLSRERAASIAKNLTVNFNRKGQVAQQAGALYAFFNASVQGTARIGKTLFDMDPGKPKTIRLSSLGKKVVYGGMMLGSVQALALAAAGFNDDDPPEFARNSSLIIPIGNKKYITIPMPMGLRMIPAIGRVSTEFALSGFKNPTKRALSMISLFADALNPIGNAGMSMQTLAPTVFDPLVALTENKDFAGRPIARESSNKATPGHMLARDTSTAVGKVLSESINWLSGGNKYTAGVVSPTPDQIDYLIAQLTGGVGRELSKVEQVGHAAFTGETAPLYKVPLLGRFVGDAKSQASEGTNFYANAARLNELETDIKGHQKDKDFEGAKQLRMSHPESYLITQANHAEQQVQKLRRQKSDLIKEGAPREQVKAIEERITARMAALNRAVEALGQR